jgi:hypothetical protein
VQFCGDDTKHGVTGEMSGPRAMGRSEAASGSPEERRLCQRPASSTWQVEEADIVVSPSLGERSTQLLDHGRVPIDKIVKEILRTCPELDGAIGGSDDPASVQKHWRTVCGFEDDLTCGGLGHAAEIARDSKDMSDRVLLGVGHHSARQRIAELCEGIDIVDDAARQVAILIIEADDMSLEGTAVEDIEGAGAASTDDASVIRPVGNGGVGLADGDVCSRPAAILRRWRWVQRLRCGRMDSDE